MNSNFVNRFYQQLFKIWRKKRFDLFFDVMKPQSADLLLDVGGDPAFWTSRPQAVSSIDLVDLCIRTLDSNMATNYHFRLIKCDACRLCYGDGSYDIGFSNSVIEHVGAWDRQQQFAAEIRRVAKGLWVQTPAYECPVEPHYLALFVHHLPRAIQKRIIRWVTLRGWLDRPNSAQIEEMVDSTRLIKKSEMQQLFPDCEIMTERIFGIIPKSYIAYRDRNSVKKT